MQKFECYIGSLDLSHYIRAIDFEEEERPERMYFQSHTKIFFRRNAYKNALLQFEMGLLAKKEFAVFLRVGEACKFYPYAQVRKTGKSLEISKGNSFTWQLHNIVEAIGGLGIIMGEVVQNLHLAFHTALGVPPRLIAPDNPVTWDANRPVLRPGYLRTEQDIVRDYAIGLDVGIEGADYTTIQLEMARRLEERIDRTFLEGDAPDE